MEIISVYQVTLFFSRLKGLDTLTLIWNGTYWLELSHSDNFDYMNKGYTEFIKERAMILEKALLLLCDGQYPRQLGRAGRRLARVNPPKAGHGANEFRE